MSRQSHKASGGRDNVVVSTVAKPKEDKPIKKPKAGATCPDATTWTTTSSAHAGWSPNADMDMDQCGCVVGCHREERLLFGLCYQWSCGDSLHHLLGTSTQKPASVRRRVVRSGATALQRCADVDVMYVFVVDVAVVVGFAQGGSFRLGLLLLWSASWSIRAGEGRDLEQKETETGSVTGTREWTWKAS